MKPILILWGILFVVIFVIVIVFSKKEFKKMTSGDTEKKAWKLMGVRNSFYEGSLIISFLISGGLAYLLKYLFNL